MRLSTIVATAALALLLPAAARAQSIDPGFSRAQVEARLGKPAAERTVGAYVYLFYNNGCEVSCGQHDIVVLLDGKVDDAIFRGPKHKREAKKAEPRPVG
jgi:hypothetical protein